LVEINLILDVFSALFLLTVTTISFAVFRFSYRYMAHYKFFARFHILLFLFVLSMIILIRSSNLLFTMVGWDGLGVTSYLLVIYYGRRKSYNAGMLTVLRNRFGDVLLMLRIGLILHLGSWNMNFYKELINLSSTFSLLLIIGSFTKRAQIPFRAWLPAAIAAPTPVSSLVHSSTLVTAGVYLLFRHLSTIMILSRLYLILFIGVATITIASISALNEKDIKKIVALSTLSQLGLIVTRLGAKWIFIRFFHLIIHAFFKAIIFIRVGNIIHFRQLYQAIKNSGGIILSSPFNSSALLMARFRLCGAPFAAAFFSKEPIIEFSLFTSRFSGYYVFLLLRVIITVLYRSRLVKVVLINFRGLQAVLVLRECDYLLRKGILVLRLPSFSRGATLRSLIPAIPHGFIYASRVKLIIFGSFLIFGLVFYISKYSLYSVGSTYLFPMWGLALVSGSLFTVTQKILSWNLNRTNFRYQLTIITKLVSLYTSDFRRLFNINFIFRVIITIPLFLSILILV